MTDDTVPVQGSLRPLLPPGKVPRVVAEIAFEAYRQAFGGSESFERFHARGGFSWSEIVAGLRGPEALRDLGRGRDVLRPQEGASDGD